MNGIPEEMNRESTPATVAVPEDSVAQALHPAAPVRSVRPSRDFSSNSRQKGYNWHAQKSTTK